MLDEFDLFIFDWDGTLSTSTSLVRITRLFKRRYDLAYIKKHESDYESSSISNIKIDEGINMLFSKAYDLYSTLEKPRLKPGAVEVLSILKKRGKKSAVFSDAISYRLMKEARLFGISELPDIFLSADSIKRYKPDPTGLLIIADRFKVRRGRCVYIGDMSSDIMTARFAKMHAGAVADGVQPFGVLEEAKTDYLFRTLKEMANIIASD